MRHHGHGLGNAIERRGGLGGGHGGTRNESVVADGRPLHPGQGQQGGCGRPCGQDLIAARHFLARLEAMAGQHLREGLFDGIAALQAIAVQIARQRGIEVHQHARFAGDALQHRHQGAGRHVIAQADVGPRRGSVQRRGGLACRRGKRQHDRGDAGARALPPAGKGGVHAVACHSGHDVRCRYVGFRSCSTMRTREIPKPERRGRIFLMAGRRRPRAAQAGADTTTQ
ncbi:hypothetical protein D3C72_1039730 [compost metagenome]